MTTGLSHPTVLCVVGARPNFMKIAPIYAAFSDYSNVMQPYLVHTGQHYDEAMKDSFFQQLGIPEPNVDLEVGSGSHAVQTAQVMLKFEPVLDEIKPCCVLVVGDVNSTIACSLVSVKKHVPVIHVEAGLRSRDRNMPEEINRILTDQLSDLLFTTEVTAKNNLLSEGISESKIHFVGNVMIDSLLANLRRAVPFHQVIRERLESISGGIEKKGYAVATLHRPSNVDDPIVLENIIHVLQSISEKIPVIFSIHPRTKKMIEQSGLLEKNGSKKLHLLPPIPYLEMLGLMHSAKLVLTDSGGLQEETTALGVPCVTLRHNTERPITVDQGTNTIVGNDPDKISACVEDILVSGGKTGHIPELWDGKAAPRIAKIINSTYIAGRN